MWKSSLDGDWVNDTKCDKCYCKFVSIPFLIRWAVSCWLHLKFNWRKCLQRLSTVISRTNSKSTSAHLSLRCEQCDYLLPFEKFKVSCLIAVSLAIDPASRSRWFWAEMFQLKINCLEQWLSFIFCVAVCRAPLIIRRNGRISLRSILIVQHNLCSGLGPNQWTDSWDPFSLCCYVFVANVICRHSYALHAYQFMHFSNMDICVCCTLKHAQCARN